MTRLITPFSMSEQGYPYRVANPQRVVNTFTASGSGGNLLSPPTSTGRAVITNLILSTDTTATFALSGSNSTTIPLYLNQNETKSISLDANVPIEGDINESFLTSCTFTGAVSGNASSVMVGYFENNNNY